MLNMTKKNESRKKLDLPSVFSPDVRVPRLVRVRRPFVTCDVEAVDPTLEVVPGKSQSVEKLYQDFVAGRLDPSQIGGVPQFDPEGSSEVDPFNHFGLTHEDADALRQASEREIANSKKRNKTVANAPADATQRSKGENEKPEGGDGSNAGSN